MSEFAYVKPTLAVLAKVERLGYGKMNAEDFEKLLHDEERLKIFYANWNEYIKTIYGAEHPELAIDDLTASEVVAIVRGFILTALPGAKKPSESSEPSGSSTTR